MPGAVVATWLAISATISRDNLGPAAEALRSALFCISESDRFIFGHQSTNCAGRASPKSFPLLPSFYDRGEAGGFVDCAIARYGNGTISWPGCQNAKGSLSDVQNVTDGRMPGLFGFDWQWAVSAANNLPVSPVKIPARVQQLQNFNFNTQIAYARAVGAVVTIDMHFLNPLNLQPQNKEGNPIVALLPGGKANSMWRAWLDGLVNQVSQDPNHAFIIRPMHEMTIGLNFSNSTLGRTNDVAVNNTQISWWWSAGAGVTPAQYRAAYNYTRWYVEEQRGVRNVLWAYAPAHPSRCYPPSNECTSASYNATSPSSYYPGDHNVDIICFDHYGKDSNMFAELLADCRLAVDFAQARGKIPAICEAGVRGGSQNTQLTDWFSRLLDTITGDDKCKRVAYMLTWSEGPLFIPPHSTRISHTYWVPIEGDPLAHDFRRFALSNSTVFAGEMGQCGAYIHAGCRTDHDCSLLGVCNRDTGVCACDPGWKGATCAIASFKPLNLSNGYHNLSSASWGGRPLRHGHEWHLYVSQFLNQCPLAYWNHNSVVARALSSTGPAGPYHYEETLFPPFHHNPSAVGPAPDGKFLLFMIGQSNASNIVDCRSGMKPVTPGSGVADQFCIFCQFLKCDFLIYNCTVGMFS